MNLNLNPQQLLGLFYKAVAIAALVAAAIVVAKAFGFAVPVRGGMQDWTWVALACAAAKHARA